MSCGITYILTLFLFGTVFPAFLLGVQSGIGAAIGRAFRQAAYLLPRYLAVGLFTVLSLGILIFFENMGVGSDPVTPAGVPNPAGALVLAVVKLTSTFGLAVFAVVFCRSYQKDLRERGELSLSEVEVFS